MIDGHNGPAKCLATSLNSTAGPVQRKDHFILARDLQEGQILLSDVLTENGTLLIKAGSWISNTILERITNFSKVNGVQEPIHVEVLCDSSDEFPAKSERRSK